jgi:hypothetical protein
LKATEIAGVTGTSTENIFGTPFMLKAALLANIHMAQASEHRIPVTHVKYFVPDNRKGVCVSLEE